VLDSTGWPGDHALSDDESAVLDAWQDSLRQFASLTHLETSVPWDRALSELHRILSESSCPELGDWFCPVLILDADVSVGIGFDAAIAVGFSDGVWPLPERGQPFIPLALRSRAGVPGSSMSDLRRLREQRARTIVTSAPQVLVTFSESLSPAVKRFTAPAASLALHTSPLPLESFSVEPLERLQDDSAPAFNPAHALHGGVSIIKAQSQCPFQAFARHRLLAGHLEEPSFGIDARDRGGYMHKALELVWRKLGNSTALQAKTHEQLSSLVHEAVSEAVADDAKSSFQRLLRYTERERLESAILEWLQLEKTRKVPFSVEFVEEKIALELAGLPLTLRVDRVDRLPDGKLVLIDYKTSADVSKAHLCGLRPREPQLLVYTLAMGDAVEGVYLAQVRAREMKVHGYAAREHFPEKKSRDNESWQSIRASLPHKLSGFAREFLTGRAVVEPQPKACEYCPCKLLCRISESTLSEP
jgi:probable DNA repair protein